MDQNVKFGVTIGHGDSYLEFFYVMSKYLDCTQYNMMLPEQCEHTVAKVQATDTRLGEKQIHVYPVTWQECSSAFT